ncbi:MAG: hypothetical protein EAZ39_02240 [Oscillatoriales cyanobacterium]|nr:MAG: hypothetical protein EAZ88_24180 [Oscillatoriales cyanobacterium]TAF98354.1 MAG: hypothetical protein EAZ45_20615 [Oscillatoriales cyanobacterium]TAG22757.1 MAG: hypothetical protein EAZ39_02240 [Oscillatoriales cyanobacterium]TAG46868.1 MAG: hypothetical protein EAZ33_05660 [Oscillatoriales cyanobacterium]TAG53991.1 MAG: hypothetical protein EAZ28_26070 [Oscillatoriales cyanobacterium]
MGRGGERERGRRGDGEERERGRKGEGERGRKGERERGRGGDGEESRCKHLCTSSYLRAGTLASLLWCERPRSLAELTSSGTLYSCYSARTAVTRSIELLSYL